MIASKPPAMPPPADVFGFSNLATERRPVDIPPLQRYAARDGEDLAYRFYDAPAERVLIFVHGSSYHGAGYHLLAQVISGAGVAKVVLPNMRGHYQSGRRR